MADDLNQNAEFGGKHKDEEDPILVAQRYLNIYHQIHIFNDVRQKEFDDSLLELPSDIRILLSTLPGGSLLLEHIAEVEEKRGIVSFADLSADDQQKNSKKSKRSRKGFDDEDKDEQTDKKQSTQTSNVNISNNVLKMLKQSEEKHDRDMQALTQAFLQSQENMANILKEVLVETKNQAPVIQQIIPPAAQQANAGFGIQENGVYSPTAQPSEQIAPQETPSKPKLFSFTKKLFSHKTTPVQEAVPQPINPFVDNTPVSLDDITDAPIALDDQTDALQNQADNFEEKEVVPSEIPATEDAPVESSDDSEWDWEYVDEDEPSSEDASDDEWEYVEEPVDEAQNNTSSEDEWEYVEEPVDEAQSNTSGEDEWEYVEEPVDQTQDTASNNDEWQYTEDEQQSLPTDENQNTEYPQESTSATDTDFSSAFETADQNYEAETPEDSFVYEETPVNETEIGTDDFSYEENQPEEALQEQSVAYENDEDIQQANTDVDWSTENAAQSYEGEPFEYADENKADDNPALDDMTTNSESQEAPNEMDQLFDQFLAANEEAGEQNIQENTTDQNDTLDSFLSETSEEEPNTSEENFENDDDKPQKKRSRHKNKNKKEQEE